MATEGQAADAGTDELAANLIEVAIYGVASLYERYPPKDPTANTTTTPNQ
jgi:hypothetical protein